MMKRFLAILLSLILMLCITASAGALVTFTDGDWSMTADNSGSKTEFHIHSYNGSEGDVMIPSSYGGYRVSAFDDYALAANQVITRLRLNSYVTEISSCCFLSASALQEVVLNSRITAIGSSAFSDTPSLVTVHLEDTKITAVNDSTFLNSGIASVKLPATCLSIGEYAFAGCKNLTRAEIPDSVNKIADSAFNGCDALVIACSCDSYAHHYAVEKGISYELLDAMEYTYVAGDTGGDGYIGIIDATIIQRMLVGLQDDPTGMYTLRGDAGSDGLSVYDATDIQRYLVGLPIDSPVGETMTKVIFFND